MKRKAKLRKANKLSDGWQIKDSLGDWVQVISRSDSKSLYNNTVSLCFRDEHGRAYRFRPKERVMSRRSG